MALAGATVVADRATAARDLWRSRLDGVGSPFPDRLAHSRYPLDRKPGAAGVVYGARRGKDLREKHLAGDDGQLFAFVEKALQVLPPRPVRIFGAADVNYFRGRAAYYLYPHSVFFDARSSELRWVAYMRSGDWLLIYHQPEIQFDISRQLLRWPTGSTTSAELKLIGPDGVLFRLR